MNKYVFNDGYNKYTRITKKRARERYDRGEPVYVIAHKLRPGRPFSYGMTILVEKDLCGNTIPFDEHVEQYCWYNAICYETGRYSAYYIEEPINQSNASREAVADL